MSIKSFAITEQLIRSGWRQRPGGNRIPRYAVAHDTGNEGSTARQNARFFNSRHLSSSAHVFIDDREIIVTIPLREKAWHVREEVSDANHWAIGVELCYGGKIVFERAYEKYVWFFSYLCKIYQWEAHLHIKAHSALDPKRRTDPENALKKYRKSFAGFLSDVDHVVQNKKSEGSETTEVR